jgi:hypothetical protein
MGVDAFLRANRLVEIGRFAITPEHRRNLLVAVALMREATRETLEWGAALLRRSPDVPSTTTENDLGRRYPSSARGP